MAPPPTVATVMSTDDSEFESTRGLPAHDVEMQMSVLWVLIASGDKIFGSTDYHGGSMEGGGLKGRMFMFMRSDRDSISRLRQYRGSDPSPSACLSLET